MLNNERENLSRMTVLCTKRYNKVTEIVSMILFLSNESILQQQIVEFFFHLS